MTESTVYPTGKQCTQNGWWPNQIKQVRIDTQSVGDYLGNDAQPDKQHGQSKIEGNPLQWNC